MKVVIVGGGTAGWIASYYLSNIQNGNEIINISSEEIPIIGVGEGTTGRFVHEFSKVQYGLNITELMYKINALPKLGIKFRNWSTVNKEFYSPIDGTYTHDFYIDYSTYVSPTSQFSTLMDNHKTNYVLNDDQLDYNIDGHAFHIDAYKTSEYFRELSIQNGVKHIEGIVRDFHWPDTLHSVTLEDGTEVTGDLFVDCSGFSRVLSDSSGWEDYSKYLPVNRAVTFRTSDEKKNEYTVAEALDNGWTWEIPTREKVGRGYVYCDEFATDVEQEIEERYGQVEWGKEISFRSGRLEKFVNKNCVSIGLSSAFLEPLQATSIHCTLVQLELFVQEFMSDIRLLEDDFLSQKYNDMVAKVYDDMRDFVALHYTGGKSDTEFWLHCRDMEKPDRVRAILYLAQSRLTRSFDFDNVVGTVRQESWNPILAGLGHFPQSVINSVMSSDGASQTFWRDQIEKFKQETGDMIQDNLSADELNELLISLG